MSFRPLCHIRNLEVGWSLLHENNQGLRVGFLVSELGAYLYTDSFKHPKSASSCSHHCSRNLWMPVCFLDQLHIMYE